MNPAIYFLSSRAKKTYVPTPITIGEQVWDQKNLDTAYYRDGTPIPNNTSTAAGTGWGATTTGAWRYYNDNSANGTIYGKLYNSFAVAGVDGSGTTRYIAPLGWRIPKASDFDALVAYSQTTTPAMLTGTNKLRETGTTYWGAGNTGTNTSLFSARGGGYISTSSAFVNISSYAYFRTQNSTVTKRITLNTNSTIVSSATGSNNGFSVRLIKEDINPEGFTTKPTSLQTLTGFTTGGSFSGLFNTTTYANITDKGIVYGLTENPTITSNLKVPADAGLTVASDYTITLSGLSTNTQYHVRAYIINNNIKYYAPNQICATGTGNASITTNNITNIDYTLATSGGNITFDGGATIIERGICYSSSTSTPTKGVAGSSTITDATGGTGSFTINMTGLVLGTNYWVRAYAVNSVRTTYAAAVSFSTRTTAITLSTTLAGDMYFDTPTSLVGGGTITNTNDTAILAKGICYSSTNNTPTINDPHTTEDSSFQLNEPFYTTATGLYPATQYYVRAYATNEGGIYYGSNTSTVTTFTPVVSLTTSSVSGINAEYFSCGASAIDNGGYQVEVGYCWGSITAPTKLSNNFSSNGITAGTSFTQISSNSGYSLTPSTPYYIRAYMIIPSLSNYIVYASNSVTFSTATAIPTITTAPVTSFTATSITSGASAITTNGVNVTAKGICWNTTGSPTKVTGSFSPAGTGSSTFSIATTNNLTYNQTYFIRAYVENAYAPHIHYGTEVFQKTATPQNFITTGVVSFRDALNVKCSATITGNDGSYPITETGYCWGITNTPVRITTPGFINYVKNPTETTFTDLASGALLSPNTQYFIRAYALNSTTGYIAYGSPTIAFTTLTATPTFATTIQSDVTANAMTISSNVTVTNGVPISARGVVWNTSTAPTIALATKTSQGTSSGSLISSVTSLSGNVQYFIRAYVTNAYGTYYSNEVIQTTLTPNMSMSTSAVTDVLAISATCGGYNIIEDSLYPITQRGYAWGNAQDVPFPQPGAYPYVQSTEGTGTSPFTISTGNQLSPLTIYNFRAYIYSESANYYAYGPTVQASKTLSATPTVTTSEVTAYDVQNITAGGSVTSTKGVPVTDKGLCWAVFPNVPTKGATNYKSAGAGEGAFSLTINGLTPGTTYNIRAYSMNEYGVLTYYATNTISQQTAIPNFSIGIVTVGATKPLSAIISATVTQNENNTLYQITSRGVCWATTSNPTKITTAGSQNYAEPEGTGTFSGISSDVSGYKLTPNTVYHFRSYATNSTTGYTIYGDNVPNVAIPADNATATTVTPATNVTTTSFDVSYTVTASTYYPTPFTSGVVYGATNPPTIGNGTVVSGTGGTASITGLSPSTTYHVRSFVTNEVKTTYSTPVLTQATNFATSIKYAYSLRRVVPGYMGPLIQVANGTAANRTYRDFPIITGGELVEADITDFVSATNIGYVSKWYDQSGNGNTLGVTNSLPGREPSIVAVGKAIRTKNGKPTLYFIGGLTYLRSVAGLNLAENNLSVFSVISSNSTTVTQNIVLYGTSGLRSNNSGNDFAHYNGASRIILGATSSNNKVYSTLSTTTGVSGWRNNVSLGAQVNTTAADIGSSISLGYQIVGATYSSFFGTIQELVFYTGNVDQDVNTTTTRTNITTEMMNYYGPIVP